MTYESDVAKVKDLPYTGLSSTQINWCDEGGGGLYSI